MAKAARPSFLFEVGNADRCTTLLHEEVADHSEIFGLRWTNALDHQRINTFGAQHFERERLCGPGAALRVKRRVIR